MQFFRELLLAGDRLNERSSNAGKIESIAAVQAVRGSTSYIADGSPMAKARISHDYTNIPVSRLSPGGALNLS